MRKFNFNGNFGEIKNIVFKTMPLGLVLVLAIFMTTSLNSIHGQTQTFSKNQEAKELSSLGIKEVVNALQNEISYLRQDMRSAPVDVNGAQSVSVNSPFHTGFINAYTHVSNNVEAGQDLQQQMLFVLQGSLFKGSDDGSQPPVLHLTPAKKQKLNDIIAFVQTWEVSEGNIGDLLEALELIRELK